VSQVQGRREGIVLRVQMDRLCGFGETEMNADIVHEECFGADEMLTPNVKPS